MLAWAGTCVTSCKAGPAEYHEGSTWFCTFELEGLQPTWARGNPKLNDHGSSMCTLGVRGKFKNVESENGRHKSYKDCYEDLCLPKFIEICGEEDRCANPKNWMK
jgi:hypothetical protein